MFEVVVIDLAARILELRTLAELVGYAQELQHFGAASRPGARGLGFPPRALLRRFPGPSLGDLGGFIDVAQREILGTKPKRLRRGWGSA